MTGRGGRHRPTDGERAVSPAFSAAESRQAAGRARRCAHGLVNCVFCCVTKAPVKARGRSRRLRAIWWITHQPTTRPRPIYLLPDKDY